MVVPRLNDLKGVDFSKKYLNPFDSVFYYKDFEIHNIVDEVNYKDYNGWGVWFKQKIIFHDHEYIFGGTTELFYFHHMSRLDFHDSFRGQIPYRGLYGYRTNDFKVYGIHFKEVLLIERLVECLKVVLKKYNLNMSHEKLCKLCGDICGENFPNIRYSDNGELSINEYLKIFDENNIKINNVESIIDDLNKIRQFKYEEFPIDLIDLNLSDDEIFPEYHCTPEFRHIYDSENTFMLNPECLLKEFEYDDELESLTRYIDFLLKENKLGLDYWIDIGLNLGHIYDAKGKGIVQFNANVIDLKNVLKKYGLKQSGVKNDLIERINNNLSSEQINNEFEGSFYLLTNEGKEYIDEHIHFTYMQPITFTFKEYIILCKENPTFSPDEILCCLAKEDWIIMGDFNWKDYLDCDFNDLDSKIVFEIDEYFTSKINKFNYDDKSVIIFNNPNLLNICPEIRKSAPILKSNFWKVSKIDEGEYNWEYSYSQYGDSGVIKTTSLEDLKLKVKEKKLPWDKLYIFQDLKRK